jgi:Zn-dependent M28 family amino/carboxypeptidase
MNKRTIFTLGGFTAAVWLVYALVIASLPKPEAVTVKFDGQRALEDVRTQVAFGPRTPGSAAHSQTVDWIRAELGRVGWQTVVQETERMGHPVRNIVAFRKGDAPVILVGAHYDSRLQANNDPDPALQMQPVPGANDGASGVAVLLELARSLPPDTVSIWLAFFDAEDNGNIEGWDWILGSRAFAEGMSFRPQAMVLVDMVGDADLMIQPEANSNATLVGEIWKQAADLGYGQQFPALPRGGILDDHMPFIEAGIPAVDLIDLNYPYWHTTHDTPDKVSAASLQAVGDTLWHWLVNRK